jgi:hypothetical protein
LVNPEEAYKEILDEPNEYDDYRSKSDFRDYVYPAVLFAYNDQNNYNKVLGVIGELNADLFNKVYKDEVNKHLRKDAMYDSETDFLYKDYVNRVRSGYGDINRKILKLLSDDMRKRGVTNISDYIKIKQELTPFNA